MAQNHHLLPPIQVPPGHAVMLGRLGPNPTLNMIVHAGSVAHIILAESFEQFSTYTTIMMAVKYQIDELNEQVESGSIDRATYMRLLKDEWLFGVVQHFLQTYGARMCPLDIRRAVDNIQENLHESVVEEWPEVVFVPMAGEANPQNA